MSLADFLFEFAIPYSEDVARIFEDKDVADAGSAERAAAPKKKKPRTSSKTRLGRRGDNKREYARGISTEDPPIANLGTSELDVPYPNFTEFQPQIGAFAAKNADNMAAVLIFVSASQGVRWSDLVQWFPDIIQWIRKNDGLRPYPDSVPWKQVVLWGASQIDFVWKYRHQIYEAVMRSIDEDTANGSTGFFVYRKLLAVPSLGYPKAGFAAQLIVGRFGCIDSINLAVSGAPKTITKKMPDGNVVFVRPKNYFKFPKGANVRGAAPEDADALARLMHGKNSPVGEQNIKAYSDYLSRIKRDASSSTCQQLWDDWTRLVEYKIWHAATPAPTIGVDYGRGPSHVVAYTGDLESPRTDRDRNLQIAKDELARNPFKDKVTGKERQYGSGRVVGRQHLDLVQASLTPVELVNVLLEDSMKLYFGATDSMMDEVREKGLADPCLASTPARAVQMADQDQGEPVVLVVIVDTSKLLADQASGIVHQHDYAASLRKGGTCFYKGTVAPAQISVQQYS